MAPQWARWLALGEARLFLAACAGMPPHLPASGVSGSDGGSEETLRFDAAGHAHFL